MGLVPHPGKVVAGTVSVLGRDVTGSAGPELDTLRGREMTMVFQDPGSSLNPVARIGDQISEVLRHRAGFGKGAAAERAVELLARVGFGSPRKRVRDYPHQLSGGMQQRVMIAMAIACEPRLLLADEPTTALDVTVQAQILDLLCDLQRDTGMAIVLVSHDLGVVSQVCDTVAVMYAGYVMEFGPTGRVLQAPSHPYTQGLMSSEPSIDTPLLRRRLRAIEGYPPDIANVGHGCPFSPRCGFAESGCAHAEMKLVPTPGGNPSACIHADEIRG
jgi:oligopeptide/dipeptide ABC transporter ATP-binding protein